MKFNFSAIAVSLLVGGVLAAPVPAGGKKVSADIDPKKAPETAKNIIQHVQAHGADSMRTTAGQFNDKDTKDALRKAAIGGKNPGQGMET